MSGDNDDQGFVTQWSKIPLPKNPQRARKARKFAESMATRRERFKKHVEETIPQSHQYLDQLAKRIQPRGQASLSQSARIFISESDAFDMLCCECLRSERFPQDILNQGRATGWYERIRMLGEKYGWEVKITIRDKNSNENPNVRK